MKNLKTITATLSLIGLIAGGAWAIDAKYAPRDSFQLVATKMDYVLNAQVEQLTYKLARLQSIRNPSPEIKRQIEDTKRELERVKKVRDQR